MNNESKSTPQEPSSSSSFPPPKTPPHLPPKKQNSLKLFGESSRTNYFHSNRLNDTEKPKSIKLPVIIASAIFVVLIVVFLFLPKLPYSRSKPITLSEFKNIMETQDNLILCPKDLTEKMTGFDVTQTYINSTPDMAIYCLSYGSDDDNAVVFLSVAENEEELYNSFKEDENTKKFVNDSGNQVWQKTDENSSVINIQVKNTMLLVFARTEEKIKEITKSLGYN